jgi:polysaccharide deacetylase family protein (PEP-CTERM system associated)
LTRSAAARAGAGSHVFSIDLEETRLHDGDAADAPSRVVAMTQRLLDFFARRGATATFFVVGELARAQPDLIRRIVDAGHEIGCHSDRHVSLDRQSPDAFRDDLCRNLDALHAAGVHAVRGYRAPRFSITESTQWAYPILAELGFGYSSSVLPARNPVAGWPDFGSAPRLISGVLELPITLLPYRALPMPMGGVYFRALPRPVVLGAFRRRRGQAVLGYAHPYDIDPDQTGAHADFPRWSPYQWVMRAGRGSVLSRLEAVERLGFPLISYAAHEAAVRQALQAAKEPG